MNNYKHLGLLTASLVAVLIISNIASTKIIQLGIFSLDGGTFLFPLTYIFGDILTEVYGYKASRRVIYTGFFWLVVSTLTFQLIIAIPPESTFAASGGQDAFAMILGAVPRIVLGSLAGFYCGEFANSYVLAKMKLTTKNGERLWQRTIGSTLVGQLVDTAVFLIIAFYGVFPNEVLLNIALSNYLFKVGIEVLFTPITYRIVAWFKRQEGVEVFDRQTNFSPWAIWDN